MKLKKAIESMKKRHKLIPAIIGMILLLPLNCCKSFPKINVDRVPEPFGIEYDVTNDVVKIPFDYWIKLNEYIISVEESLTR